MFGKLFCEGWAKYFQYPMNIIDFVSTIAWFASLHSSWNGYNLCVRVLRLFRLLNITTTSRSLVMTLARITRPSSNFLCMLMILWYLFAIIGMEAWHGMLTPDKLPSDCAYAQAGYWPFNFDSIQSTYAVLFNLWVVNNWYIMMDAIALATGQEYTRLYFILFYFICVPIATNIIVAFVMEASVQQFQSEIEKRKNQSHQITGSFLKTKDEVMLENLLKKEQIQVRVLEREGTLDLFSPVLNVES